MHLPKDCDMSSRLHYIPLFNDIFYDNPDIESGLVFYEELNNDRVYYQYYCHSDQPADHL